MSSITLQSKDGKDFDIKDEVAKLCEPLEKMLSYGMSTSDDGSKKVHKAPIKAEALEQALKWAETHEEAQRGLPDEDRQFFKVSFWKI